MSITRKKRSSRDSRRKSRKATKGENPATIRREVRNFLRSPELNYLPPGKYEQVMNMLKPYMYSIKPEEISTVRNLLYKSKEIIEEEKKKARSSVYNIIVKEIQSASGEPLLIQRLENLLEKTKGSETIDPTEIEKQIEKTKEKYYQEKKNAIKDLTEITKELSEHEDEELASLAREVNKSLTIGIRPSRYVLEELQKLGNLLNTKDKKRLTRTIKKILEVYRPAM